MFDYYNCFMDFYKLFLCRYIINDMNNFSIFIGVFEFVIGF